MKRAIAELYAYIMKFLIRAKIWCQENKLKHAWHAFSRPPELRYGDLLRDIELRSKIVSDLSVSGNQAEQRVMHTKIDIENERIIALQNELSDVKAILLCKYCTTIHVAYY